MELYRLGDFEGALHTAQAFRNHQPLRQLYCVLTGETLAQLGRFEEAEAILRQNINECDESKEKKRLANGWCTLGHVDLTAGHADEARNCFKSGIDHDPTSYDGYPGMAKSCLIRSGSPADAIRWTRLATARAMADTFPLLHLRRLRLADCLATLAWATAVSSRDASEVTLWVAEAQKIDPSGHVPMKAIVEHHAGCAYAELRDSENSVKHPEECARVDLQGHWGREARRMLT